MKTIVTTISLLLAVSSGQLRGEEEHTKWIVLKSAQMVPVGKTYFVYDGKGKKVAEFKSGQKTNMSTDCVIIKCPSSFGQDVVCWKCMGFAAQTTGQPGPTDRGNDTLMGKGGFEYTRVPTGKKYFVYDGKRKRVAEFRSGQKTNMSTDCVIIKCPSSFGKDVVCWQCMGFTAKPDGQSPTRATANVKVKEASKPFFKPKPSGQ
jgi:hypothetical protein